MKICVLMPTKQHRKSAGARIRYQRMSDFLKLLGHTLYIVTFDEMTSSVWDADIVMFSKFHGAESIALARKLKAAGTLIGIDVFDDVFSQTSDSRLVLNRLWLADVGLLMDFAICSTPRMAAVLHSYMPEVPIRQVNDPVAGIDAAKIADSMSSRLAEATASGALTLCWFGIGDNPNFPVGLRDLSAYSNSLVALSQAYNVKLRILTNRRALTAPTLQRLARLPVAYTLEEWSEAGEKEALETSILTFIPVNSQPFSAAKSLNRAISTLSSGSQLLTVGYGLYDALDPLLYHDAQDFLDDLKVGRLRMRRDTLPVLIDRVIQLADPATESSRFAAFLTSISLARPQADNRPTSPCQAIVYGYKRQPSSAAVEIGILVGTPFSGASSRFDIRFVIDDDGCAQVLFNERAMKRLAPGMMLHAIDAAGAWYVPVTAVAGADASVAIEGCRVDALNLSTYRAAMVAIHKTCQVLLSPCVLDVQEGEPPFVMARRPHLNTSLQAASS